MSIDKPNAHEPKFYSTLIQTVNIAKQLLNELSYEVLVDQVLKQIYQALQPEQLGLSSLIRLEAVYKIT